MPSMGPREVEEWLSARWRDLSTGGLRVTFAEAIAYLDGQIDALRIVGLINAVEKDGWRARIRACPGHEGGGQVWCAYCGDLPREATCPACGHEVHRDGEWGTRCETDDCPCPDLPVEAVLA